jgi:protein tyrosine/serine phosphatase
MANEIANEIVSRLWLGNKQAAADESWLKQHNVTVVFNCTKTLPFANGVRRMYRVPVDDNLEAEEIFNMGAWAAETQTKLVREYKAGRTILVHCHAGMQRSAAVVAMFLITMTGMTADEAIAFVKSKRPVAFFPAVNFEKAIREWDDDLRKYRSSQQNGHVTSSKTPSITATAN